MKVEDKQNFDGTATARFRPTKADELLRSSASPRLRRNPSEASAKEDQRRKYFGEAESFKELRL